MKDCTKVLALMDKVREKTTVSQQLAKEIKELERKAQDLCTHPAIYTKRKSLRMSMGIIQGKSTPVFV